jgi:hypothetical protein
MAAGDFLGIMREPTMLVLRTLLLFLLALLSGCGKSPEEKLKAESDAKMAWVTSNIKVGMTKEEVILKAGKPTTEDDNPKFVDGPANGRAFMSYYEGPPDLRVKENWGYGGFEVQLKDGRVTYVSIIHRNVP